MRLDKKSRLIVYSCYLAYFLSGIVTLCFGAILPKLIAQKGLSYTLAGGLLTSNAIGNLLASFVYPALSKKFGEKNVTVALSLCYPICLWCFTITDSVWLLYLFVGLIGLNRGIITLTNNRTVNTMTGNSPKHQNILHMTFAVGAFTSPFAISLLTDHNIGWETILRGIAVLTVIIPIFYSQVDKDAIAGKGINKETTSKNVAAAPKTKALFAFTGFWLAMGIIFCYIGLENTVNGWFKTYLLEIGMMDDAMAGAMVSVTWFMIMVGRLVVASVSGKVKPPTILAAISSLQFVALILLITAKSSTVVVIALILFGLGLAGIYPTLMAYAGAIINNTNTGMSILTGVGSVGGIITPQLIGVIADNAGFNVAILLMVVSSVILFVLAGFTIPEAKKRLAVK